MKTGQRVTIHIERRLQEIIDRRVTAQGPFLLPIVGRGTPEAQFRRYRSQLSLYNRQLKKLSRMMHTYVNLTSYTPRHTWATLAYARRASVNVIGRGLGHSLEHTTRIYINDMADEKLVAVNRKIICDLFRD